MNSLLLQSRRVLLSNQKGDVMETAPLLNEGTCSVCLAELKDSLHPVISGTAIVNFFRITHTLI